MNDLRELLRQKIERVGLERAWFDTTLREAIHDCIEAAERAVKPSRPSESDMHRLRSALEAVHRAAAR